MARKCSNRTICGMKGGLLNPFFQNGVDLTGQSDGSGGSSTPANAVLHEDGTVARYEDDTTVTYES
jgi:hypothetical protein